MSAEPAAPAEVPPITLKSLIHKEGAAIQEIADFLDEKSHANRLAALYTLGRKDQRLLYQLAASAPPATLEFFVPPSIPSVTAIAHHGKNTLPIPGFTRFQKVMSQPDDGSERVFGYNRGRSEGFIGPGYFVAVPTAGNSAWEERGAIVVDYYQIPDGAIPEGWPRIRPNSSGLQTFVYHHTRDFMRIVSRYASVGAAYKEENALDHYFILCREDPA